MQTVAPCSSARTALGLPTVGRYSPCKPGQKGSTRSLGVGAGLAGRSAQLSGDRSQE